jgi:hypothetical protein
MASIQAFHCAPETPKWPFPVMMCSSSWIDSWMKITMRYPLRTFWRRQARGQEVLSAATARRVVQQMVGRYARQRPINGARACLGAPSSRIRRQRNGSGMCECRSQGRRQVRGPSRGVTHINDQKDPSEPKRNRGDSFGMPLSRMPKPTTGRARASIWALSRSFSSTRRRSSAVFSSSVRLSSTPTRGQIR